MPATYLCTGTLPGPRENTDSFINVWIATYILPLFKSHYNATLLDILTHTMIVNTTSILTRLGARPIFYPEVCQRSILINSELQMADDPDMTSHAGFPGGSPECSLDDIYVT